MGDGRKHSRRLDGHLRGRQFTTVTQTVTESSCVFELPDLKRDYTFTVSA